MFSYATKVLGALTAVAALAAGVYFAVQGDRAGAVLLLMLSLAALLAMLTVVASRVVDIAPHVPADAPAPERNAHTPGPAATGSAWPILSAAAVTILAIGAATNEVVVYAGVIAVALASIGWFSKAWADHPSWTPRIQGRIVDRFVAPLTFPVFGVVLTGLIAISISRILLASSVKVAPWISLVVAVAVLAACWWVASRPLVASTVLSALAVVAGVSMVGAGIAGAAQGEREFHHKGHVAKPVVITAKDNQFKETEVKAKPDHGKVLVKFKNKDPEVFHNVAIYEDKEITSDVLVNGSGFPGSDTRTYSFELKPGRYAFRCDFHANMVGTFVVEGG